MAFLDKIGDFAKNIGEKTNDSIELIKLNSKINAEKDAIGALYRRIGEAYYQQSQGGSDCGEAAGSLCSEIRERNMTIAELQADIDRIKAAQAAPPAQPVQPYQPPVQAAAGSGLCPSCGKPVSPGGRFCRECGCPIDQGGQGAQ